MSHLHWKIKCPACNGYNWTLMATDEVGAGLIEAAHIHMDCANPDCNGWRHTIELDYWPQEDNTGLMNLEEEK